MLDIIILCACIVIAECMRQKMQQRRYDQVEKKIKGDVSKWLKGDED